VSDELVRLTIVPSEVEAEIVRGLLEDAGIRSLLRPTDAAAAAFDGWAPGGAREVLVAAADLERARELVDEK
jgi:Putative prokaryotic signal transducing protein